MTYWWGEEDTAKHQRSPEGQHTAGLFILNLPELSWLSTQQNNVLHNRKAKSRTVKRFRYQETAFQGPKSLLFAPSDNWPLERKKPAFSKQTSRSSAWALKWKVQLSGMILSLHTYETPLFGGVFYGRLSETDNVSYFHYKALLRVCPSWSE